MPRAKDAMVVMDEEMTAELKAIEAEVLAAASEIMERNVRLQSLHAIIGGKNNVYTDAVREEFSSPEHFFARWLNGLGQAIQEDRRNQRKYGREYDTSAVRLGKMLQVPIVLDYARTFFARNFYRNLKERTRFKPEEELWSVWFGDNQLPWGILLSPVYRDGEWTNDKSEIRRANYEYWTVQHALTTGLIVPGSTRIMSFSGVSQLLSFYEGVLKRSSVSQYEKAVADRYLSYIENSPNPVLEPLLIPEIRYEGKEVKHKYRLDFSVLNPYSRRFTGFELSPASTHINVEGIPKANLTKVKANEHLKLQWEKEMAKRNDYFKKFGITTVTFADDRLIDIDDCFSEIRLALSERPSEAVSEEAELAKIASLI